MALHCFTEMLVYLIFHHKNVENRKKFTNMWRIIYATHTKQGIAWWWSFKIDKMVKSCSWPVIFLSVISVPDKGTVKRFQGTESYNWHILHFHSPFKILCHTLKLSNFVIITGSSAYRQYNDTHTAHLKIKPKNLFISPYTNLL